MMGIESHVSQNDGAIMTDRVLPMLVRQLPADHAAVLILWNMSCEPAPTVAQGIETVASHAREVGWDVLHLFGPRSPKVWERTIRRGVDGHDDTVWLQVGTSAFADFGLLMSLRNRECASLILVGGPLEDEIDVTARDGADLGFQCWVVGDAVQSRTDRQSNLDRLATYSGVYVTGLSEVLTASSKAESDHTTDQLARVKKR
jgi:hypothetical protein